MNTLYLSTQRTRKVIGTDRKLTRYIIVLVSSISLIFSQLPSLAQNTAAPEIAGHVIFTTGRVIARDISGLDRSLGRKAPIEVGDTLYTGPNASTQIRMVDSAVISLKASTEFSIVAYQFENNPNTDSVSLELVKGGFRTITGTIGDQNKEAYEATIANFATIGIRGTHYEVTISETGEMFTGVYDGGTVVSNNGGFLDLGVSADFDFARVENENTPPEGLLTQAPELGNILINNTIEDDDDDESDAADNDSSNDDSQDSNTSSNGGTDNTVNADTEEISGVGVEENDSPNSDLDSQSADQSTTDAGIDNNSSGDLNPVPAITSALSTTASARAPTVITAIGVLNTASSAETNAESSSLAASINPNEFGSGLAACSGNAATCQDSTSDPEESDSSITIETGDETDSDDSPGADDTTEPDEPTDSNGDNGGGSDDDDNSSVDVDMDDSDSTPGNSGNDNSNNGNGNNNDDDDDSSVDDDKDDSDSTPGNSGNDNSNNGNGNNNDDDDDSSVDDDKDDSDSTPGNSGNDNSNNGNGNNNDDDDDSSVDDDKDDSDSTPGNSGNDNSNNGNGNNNDDDDDSSVDDDKDDSDSTP
ncbi:MAG: hypothetical protein ACI87Q_001881, partial [Pseudohongiellaceae bacterium]